jgi:hypothetical protein
MAGALDVWNQGKEYMLNMKPNSEFSLVITTDIGADK